MAASRRDRRPAIWPYLVMPLIVLAAFYVLSQVRQRPGPHAPEAPGAAAAPGGER